jgi:hypothetical protein
MLVDYIAEVRRIKLTIRSESLYDLCNYNRIRSVFLLHSCPLSDQSSTTLASCYLSASGWQAFCQGESPVFCDLSRMNCPRNWGLYKIPGKCMAVYNTGHTAHSMKTRFSIDISLYHWRN